MTRLLPSIAFACLLAATAGYASPADWQAAVDRAARRAPQARIVVLDVSSGHLLASHRLGEAARTLAAPGSTLKPLVLYQLASGGRWDPARRVECGGALFLAGHRMACSHPPGPPFDAREALAWSCNSYFAAVARSLRPGELGGLLRPTGLLGASGIAPGEALADFRETDDSDGVQLAVLGTSGIRVSLLELAAAYRWLALQLAAHSDSEAARVVRAGLEDSASFGMAGAANLGGVPVAGKTGTAENAANPNTHGWFAGLAPARNPRIVVVVFVPTGHGADAAHIAGEILKNAPLAH